MSQDTARTFMYEQERASIHMAFQNSNMFFISPSWRSRAGYRHWQLNLHVGGTKTDIEYELILEMDAMKQYGSDLNFKKETLGITVEEVIIHKGKMAQ